MDASKASFFAIGWHRVRPCLAEEGLIVKGVVQSHWMRCFYEYTFTRFCAHSIPVAHFNVQNSTRQNGVPPPSLPISEYHLGVTLSGLPAILKTPFQTFLGEMRAGRGPLSSGHRTLAAAPRWRDRAAPGFSPCHKGEPIPEHPSTAFLQTIERHIERMS